MGNTGSMPVPAESMEQAKYHLSQLSSQADVRITRSYRNENDAQTISFIDHGYDTSRHRSPPTPAVGSAAPAPILACQLKVGLVRSSCALEGVVALDAFCTGGVYFLLKDAIGHSVRIGVYGTGVPLFDDKSARKLFPLGAHIRIHSPYFKEAAFGPPFVRVDDPSSVAFMDHDPSPQDDDAWYARGNAAHELWKKSDAVCDVMAAEMCWLRGTVEDAKAASLLLSNRAQAHLSMKRAANALIDALAASYIDPKNAKALLRLAVAAKELGMMPDKIIQGPGKVGELADVSKALSDAHGPPPWWWEVAEGTSDVLAGLGGDYCNPVGCLIAVPEGDTSDELRAKGNKKFKEGEWDKAAAFYTAGMARLSEGRLVKLLCNLSLVRCAKGERKHNVAALADATVALLLEPGRAKTRARRATALKKLGLEDAAIACCKAGGESDVLLKGMAATMMEKKKRTSKAQEFCKDGDVNKKAGAPLTAAEIAKAVDECDKLKRSLDEDVVDVEGMELFNAMVAGAFASPLVQMKMYGRLLEPMPDFRAEYLASKGAWPHGVPGEFAVKCLRRTYANQCMLPQSMEMDLASDKWQPSNKDLLKRLNFRMDRLKWYMNSEWGDIYDKDSEKVASGGNTIDIGSQVFKGKRYEFSNQAYRKEVLTRGKVHVAIGFVDLGTLLTAELIGGGIVNFVGYEMSEFCCAKTAVVWKMLCAGEESARAVLQVWYSTSWSKATQAAFREAAQAVHGKTDPSRSQETEAILAHWAASPGVPLSKARAEWAKGNENHIFQIGSLKRRKDRIAMTRYELTGDFGVDRIKQNETTDMVGSMTMFDCPEDAPPLWSDQKVFSVLSLMNLSEALGPSKNQTVVAAAESYLLVLIVKLARHAREGYVMVSLRHAAFEERIDEIAALMPWSVSWSNVLDYYTPSEFHTLARSISRHGDTVHYGYSMNWKCDIKGSFLIDFAGKKLAAFCKEIMKSANDGTSMIYTDIGLSDILRSPPPTNPFNTVSVFLATCPAPPSKEPLYKMWLSNFMLASRSSGPGAQVANADPPVLSSPFSSTGDGSIHFSWSYDLEISFFPHQ